MKSIRIGKEIALRWPILTNGAPLPLEGRDLKLLLRLPSGEERELPFRVEGHEVVCLCESALQQTTGIYGLTLWENSGRDGQTAVDCCRAFRLVASTCRETGADEGLATETLMLEGATLETGVAGPKGDAGFSPVVEVVGAMSGYSCGLPMPGVRKRRRT